MSVPVPHRMKLSMRRNSLVAVWCTCMAQTNDQDRKPESRVDWRFWGFDYIAIIPVTQSAGAVFRAHVEDYDARRARGQGGEAA